MFNEFSKREKIVLDRDALATVENLSRAFGKISHAAFCFELDMSAFGDDVYDICYQLLECRDALMYPEFGGLE